MYEINKTTRRDEFQRVAFVLKARSESVQYPFMTVVHVEHTKTGSRLIATDGKRLHVTEIAAKIPIGDYKPTITKDTITFLNPLEEQISYPEWKTVIPKTTTEKATINLKEASMGRNQAKNAEMTVAFKQFLDSTGELVNLRYLDDLLKTSWVICTQTKRKAIMLKPQQLSHTTFAVIMPMGCQKTA